MHRFKTEAPFLLLAGPILVQTSTSTGHRENRPVCVIESPELGPVAFYRSLGTGGQTASGQWVPFGGMTDRHFIKLPFRKLPPGPFSELSQALERRFADLKFERLPALRENGNRQALRIALNRWLAPHGALRDDLFGFAPHEDLNAPDHIEPEKTQRIRF